MSTIKYQAATVMPGFTTAAVDGSSASPGIWIGPMLLLSAAFWFAVIWAATRCLHC